MTTSALIFLSLALSAAPPAPTASPVCRAGEGPDYYAFPLTGTGAVPGMGLAKGLAEVSLAPTSPFSVAVTADGSYAYRVAISLQRMKAPRQGTLTAWLTTRDIDRVVRLGSLDDELRARGTVDWNQFLVVITLEPEGAAAEDHWRGPIVFRGMSVSGRMHTMLGHGALQQENCASYGFGGR